MSRIDHEANSPNAGTMIAFAPVSKLPVDPSGLRSLVESCIVTTKARLCVEESLESAFLMRA